MASRMATFGDRLSSNLKYLLQQLFYPAVLGTLFVLLLQNFANVDPRAENYGLFLLTMFTVSYAGFRLRYMRAIRHPLRAMTLVCDYLDVVLIYFAYRALGFVDLNDQSIPAFCGVTMGLFLLYIVYRAVPDVPCDRRHLKTLPSKTYRTLTSRWFWLASGYCSVLNWCCLLGVIGLGIEWLGFELGNRGFWPAVHQWFGEWSVLIMVRCILWMLLLAYLVGELLGFSFERTTEDG